ncbi:MAG: response regulator transcription factor [Peptoniphilus sp.]|nr:response regulator transcription factor [Peptoniphilus sp.]MDY6045120.1 response regulator transcription factor [Peptoniphilus sp.]
MEGRIFFVEDDAVIRRQIAKYLRAWGYEVFQAEDFSAVDEEFKRANPHIVLLDVGLPYYNGYYWCRKIREVSRVPIVFLSASAEEMNMIMAMDMGADDYLVKPYDVKVLRAKVAALMRRTYEYGEREEMLSFKDVRLDPSHMAFIKGEEREELTRNEYKILETLMKKDGAVVSRNEIIAAVWEGEDFVDDNTLTVNIMRLRKRLGEKDCAMRIETKKGVGYYVS